MLLCLFLLFACLSPKEREKERWIDEEWCGKELGGAGGGETLIRIRYMKTNIFSFKKKVPFFFFFSFLFFILHFNHPRWTINVRNSRDVRGSRDVKEEREARDARRIVFGRPSVLPVYYLDKARLCISSDSEAPSQGSAVTCRDCRESRSEARIHKYCTSVRPAKPAAVYNPQPYPVGQPTDLKWQLHGSLQVLFMPRKSLCVGSTATDSLKHSGCFYIRKAKQMFQASPPGSYRLERNSLQCRSN